MITIIHGSDIVASRKFFFMEKEKYPDAYLLDGEKISITDLTQIFEGGGLFDENKTMFIEHFFNRKKKKEEFAMFSEFLQKQNNHTIYLWEGKELEKSSLLAIKTAIPRVFKLPQTLFILLDSLKPNNGKQLVTLFHQTLESTDAEMIFFMLIRQIRILLALQDPAEEQIDELKRMAPWQKSKLEQQAKLFTREQLISICDKLFALEIGQKTGTLPNKILTIIDFLLIEI